MALTSWLTSATDAATDFPIQNLPYGVFRHAEQVRIGVAIGDRILDLHGCASQGLLAPLSEGIITACCAHVLNPLMSLGPAAWSSLRRRLTALLNAEQVGSKNRTVIESLLVPMREAEMLLPARIGDYTDFYASIHHA